MREGELGVYCLKVICHGSRLELNIRDMNMINKGGKK